MHERAYILFPNVAIHDSLEGRVARGAALLDDYEPGWHRRIDTDRLAMVSESDDVLGQLYGHYARGFRRILAVRSAGTIFSAAAHGFTLTPEEQDCELGEAYARFARLTECWRALIARRSGREG